MTVKKPKEIHIHIHIDPDKWPKRKKRERKPWEGVEIHEGDPPRHRENKFVRY